MTASYDEWTTWPIGDVIDFADDLAAQVGLDDAERLELRESMWFEAGYGPWSVQGPKPRYFKFPRVPPPKDGFSEAEWMEIARLHNAPRDPEPIATATQAERPEYRWEDRGDGLSARRVLVSGPFMVEHRRKMQVDPFRIEAGRICNEALLLLWRKGHFRISRFAEQWIGPPGLGEPHKGLFWYYSRVIRWRIAANHFVNSPFRSSRQRAMFCALKMGQTFTEMELRAAHNDFHVKSQLTRDSQSAGGKKNRAAPSDEQRRAAWWKYRQQGMGKVDAGWAAADELGLSEPSIRRAFPNDRYPNDLP